MANTDTNRPAATDEDRRKYQEAWAEMMVNIWREKIERLHVINTYSLHQQIRDNVISATDSVSTIQHKFLESAYTRTWVSATDIPKVTAVT